MSVKCRDRHKDAVILVVYLVQRAERPPIDSNISVERGPTSQVLSLNYYILFKPTGTDNFFGTHLQN